jgi:predicted O-methyltransferase YrrM
MASRTISMTDTLNRYMLDVSLREPPKMAALRAETEKMPEFELQIAPEQAQFMAFLVKTLGARRGLEVGVFAGYSALAVVLAMPDDGRLVACEVNPKWAAIAQRNWEAAGVAHKIDLRLAPALDTLSALVGDEAERGAYDFAFIDADKPNYPTYYEHCLTLLRPGGLIVIDNVFLGGAVIDPARQDAGIKAIRQLNTRLRDDERVDLSLVPIGDGMTLVRKR